MKKYELTNEAYYINGRTLYRIQALQDFGDVKAGDIGGFIESESNLSQYGDCWIYDDSMAFEQSMIYDHAQIRTNSKVYGNAQVYGDVILHHCLIYDYAQVYGQVYLYNETLNCVDYVYNNHSLKKNKSHHEWNLSLDIDDYELDI